MSVEAQKKKGSRKKRGLLIAGIILLIIVGVALAVGMPWIRWYLDGSNPDTPVAAPAEGVQTNAFDFDTRTVLLNNGVEMPIYGIGTYNLTPEEAEESVYWALEAGARLIDTAHAYNNEEGVGRGIQRAIEDGIVTRDEIFVTTKLWMDDYSEEGIEERLENLNLDYIDLLLIHQPQGNYTRAWELMEQYYNDGKLRAIGLSNFSDEQFAELAAEAEVIPAVLQVETHLHNQQVAMKGFLNQYGTVLEAWFPLGGRGNTSTYLTDETVNAIADAHGKSAAQIILRWHLQDGHIAIPGSHNPDHIRENTELFDFELTDEEMAQLRALNLDEAYFSMIGQTSDDTQEKYGTESSNAQEDTEQQPETQTDH